MSNKQKMGLGEDMSFSAHRFVDKVRSDINWDKVIQIDTEGLTSRSGSSVTTTTTTTKV